MVNSAFIKKLWNWFDNWFLLFATAFLIVFIPLYPKIPIADLIPGYVVRLRLEDFFIAIAAAWWGIQVIRRKISWKTPLTAAIGLYIITGLLSNIAGVYITQTIPAQTLHVGKSMLHWARYVQYFSVFFIAYSSVKTRKQAVWLLILSLITVLAIGLYGFGQKHWYWPVYSTMNREYSKGVRLYLGPFARVQSTFGGHYDLGAYLVVMIPFALAFFFALGNLGKNTAISGDQIIPKRLVRPLRWISIGAWFTGLWLQVMSASRASFVGYLLSTGIILLYWAVRFKNWKWFVSRSAAIFGVTAFMLIFVGDLSTRFAQLIDKDKYPVAYQTFMTVNNFANSSPSILSFLDSSNFPKRGKSLAQLEAELNEAGMTTSDIVPTPERPSDVLTDHPQAEVDPSATMSAGVIFKDGRYVEEIVWSECALQRSLSLCIRLETLWPQAFRGFERNPLLGSGYGTLTAPKIGIFTEGDSTDNNFLRTLGETGALGFFFFYGAIGLCMWFSWQVMRSSKDVFLAALAIASFTGSLGLLANAVYIDVFASSKVAYTFWLLQGVVIALFVREGLVGQSFAFERLQVKKETTQLSQLLKNLEAQRETKYKDSHYLSAAKQSAKRRKGKKKGSPRA